MSLRLRRLKLVADTPQGTFGTDISFDDGLVVLRADNTSGKSTCIQAIFYALGLESMLTTRHAVPLPHAMTEFLETEHGQLPVNSSYVVLEVENHAGTSMTVQRWAKSDVYQPNLIHVWDGPALSQPDAGFTQQDMYVRLRGSAQEGGAGFYPRLERFMNWQLPRLVRADGQDQKLYMEMIFPLFFVEQKRGWGGIQVQMPPYQGVPEPRRRAIEFTLGLDVYERAQHRREVEAALADIASAWRVAVESFEDSLLGSGVSLQGVSDQPPGVWPPEIAPTLLVLDGEDWKPVQEVAQVVESRLAEMEQAEIPNAETAATETATALRQNQETLSNLAVAVRALDDEARAEEQQLDSLDRRLETLAQDLRQNRDALTLRRLGGSAHLHLLEGECPTCHQQVPPSLLEPADLRAPMSVEDNITFIQEQQQMFEAMRSQSERAFEGKKERLSAMYARMDELRKEIRAQSTALLSPGTMPSLAALEERLRQRDRLADLQRLQEDLSTLLLELEELAERHKELSDELRALPDTRLSESDGRKLDRLQAVLREQLGLYGFRSFDYNEIEISDIRYTPSREGYDLGFDLSASDGIRTIWAYLLSLMEIARQEETNHPGLLIFDEPRQQEADPLSVEALVARAAQAHSFGQQVIFATSEPMDSLTAMLSGHEHSLISFEGKILAPLD